jgi:hypothetical protein
VTGTSAVRATKKPPDGSWRHLVRQRTSTNNRSATSIRNTVPERKPKVT